LRLTILRQKQRVFKMRGEAYVEDTLVAEAELMAALESGEAEKDGNDS
jgi:3-hydroxymyristoyl/3-hydroxydecanoyl-(acyl carrier protein) dehydratase